MDLAACVSLVRKNSITKLIKLAVQLKMIADCWQLDPLLSIYELHPWKRLHERSFVHSQAMAWHRWLVVHTLQFLPWKFPALRPICEWKPEDFSTKRACQLSELFGSSPRSSQKLRRMSSRRCLSKWGLSSCERLRRWCGAFWQRSSLAGLLDWETFNDFLGARCLRI